MGSPGCFCGGIFGVGVFGDYTGGRYLQEHDLGDMADDMTSVVRRYPLPALCIGFGVGFLLGMALTRR
jgi:hypothetical protein